MKKTLTVIAIVSTSLFAYSQKKLALKIGVGNTFMFSGQNSTYNPNVKIGAMVKVTPKTQIGLEVGGIWFKTETPKVITRRNFAYAGIKSQIMLDDRIGFILGGGYLLNYQTNMYFSKTNSTGNVIDGRIKTKGKNVDMFYASTGVVVLLAKNKKITPFVEMSPIVYISNLNTFLGFQTSFNLSF